MSQDPVDASPSPAARALSRLRDDPTAAARLVTLGLDTLLDRPLAELVDRDGLAAAVAEGIRSAARSDELEAWMADRVEAALAHADALKGPVGEHVPVTVLGPLQTALEREITPDERLVRLFVDHPSFRQLIADMLRENLLAFGRRLRAMMDPGLSGKKGAGMGFASALAGMAKGVASAVSEQVERQLEDRVSGYIDDVLSDVVDNTVRRIADPDNAEAMAKWRIDVLHGVMNEPLEHLVAERHKYPPQVFAADVSRILRALAGWKQLSASVEAAVSHLFDHYGQQSARAFLEGSGLEQAWRPELERLLARQVQVVAGTDRFADWLDDLLAPARGTTL